MEPPVPEATASGPTSARFPSSLSARVTQALVILVFLGFTTCFIGVVVARSMSIGKTIWFLLFGTLTGWLGVYATTNFVRAVVVDESGLVVHGVVRSRRVRWSDVGAVELRYEPKAEKWRRAKMIWGGFVGIRLWDVPCEFDDDPVELRALRSTCRVAATVFDKHGECVAFGPDYVGWSFVDALRARAEAHGVEVRSGRGVTYCPA